MRAVLAMASSDSSSPESQWVLGRVIIKCSLSAAASGFLRGELTERPGCPASCLSAMTALLVSICPFIWNGSSLINKGKSNPQPWHMASVARLEWLIYCSPSGSKPARACLGFQFFSSRILVTHSGACFLMTLKMSGIPYCWDSTLYICRMDTNSAK